MNLPKSTKILSMIAIISVVIATITLYTQTSKGTLESEETQFAIADSGAVDKIIISQKGKTLTLLKDGIFWKINNSYLVDEYLFENMKNLMFKSQVTKPVSKDILAGVQKIMKDEATEITMCNNKDILKKIKYVTDSKQLIAQIDGSTNLYFIDFPVNGKMPFANLLTANIADWRDRTIFSSSIANINELSVSYTDSSQYDFKIIRGLNKFQIAQLKDADSTKILAYLDLYKNVQIRRYCSENEQIKKDSLLKIKPTFVITLKDKNAENSNSIQIYYKNNQKSDIYALIGNQLELVVIKPRIFEYLLQKKVFFLKSNLVTTHKP